MFTSSVRNYLLPCSRGRVVRCMLTRLQPVSNLVVVENVVTAEEEQFVLDFVTNLLRRKKYEVNHWDDVIVKYKEVDLGSHLQRIDGNDPNAARINDVVTKMKTAIQSHMKRPEMIFQSPHVIDLAADGWIGPHIDSIKFSGDMIAGLSLGAERRMVMRKSETTPDTLSDELKKELALHPSIYEFPLKPRSLYIMTGVWRYHFTHEITKTGREDAPQPTGRRVSIIIRNEREPT